MTMYSITITLSHAFVADSPEAARVKFIQALDAGNYDHELMEADVEEVKPDDHQA